MTLTADNASFTQLLRVEMDPRSQATAGELTEQLRVGLQIYGEVQNTRQALAEISKLKKRLEEVEAQSLKQHPELLGQVKDAQSAIGKIEKGEKPTPGGIVGLDLASTGLAAALRVVGSSDRAIPSQAMELYREADRVAKAQLAAWASFKNTQVPKLNEALLKAGMASIPL